MGSPRNGGISVARRDLRELPLLARLHGTLIQHAARRRPSRRPVPTLTCRVIRTSLHTAPVTAVRVPSRACVPFEPALLPTVRLPTIATPADEEESETPPAAALPNLVHDTRNLRERIHFCHAARVLDDTPGTRELQPQCGSPTPLSRPIHPRELFSVNAAPSTGGARPAVPLAHPAHARCVLPVSTPHTGMSTRHVHLTPVSDVHRHATPSRTPDSSAA